MRYPAGGGHPGPTASSADTYPAGGYDAGSACHTAGYAPGHTPGHTPGYNAGYTPASSYPERTDC